ncbi:MAG: metallophosphoesterase family protein [Ruminococcus sp.]|nr:metallophosphoesterase family protein [Ruminococcus sp.]
MEGHRIGVISDTHGLLRPETAAVLKTCEIILHAGDVGKPEVLRQLRSIADTRAVRCLILTASKCITIPLAILPEIR